MAPAVPDPQPALAAAALLLWRGACILPLPRGHKGPPPAQWNGSARERISWTLPALERALLRVDNWAAGILSHSLGCIDFDTRHSWLAFLDGPYASVPFLLIDTPRGGHAWIQAAPVHERTKGRRRSKPAFGSRQRARILADTGAESFRTRGSYAVGPGSHVEGQPYTVRRLNP